MTGGNNANEYVWMGELTKVYNKLKAEGLFNTTKLYIVKGNHDMNGTENLIPVGTADAWNESTNSYDNDFYNGAYRVKIKGYNLIGFDANINSSSTVGKATNYLNQIKSEADYDPTKPIFAMSHYPIGGTVWGSAWSSGASNNFGKFIADNNFSQVFYMSGHTQYDPTDERSLYQGTASFLDSGGSNYSSYQDDGPFGGYIEGSYGSYHTAPRISNFIEVYGTKLILKQYNLATDEFVSIPRVVNVGEGKDAFSYSKSDIRELIAPQFDEGIKIDSFNNNEVAFTIKQANDNVRGMEYNIQLINKLTGKVDKSFNSLSYPMDKPFDVYRHYKFTGLTPNTPYIIRVFADDSMYNRSSEDIDLKINTGNLKSITAPADITGVAFGSAKTADALRLPGTVSLVTDEGVGNANVTWNVDASNYDPTVMTVQTFTVNGTVTLPTGVANPNNVPLTTSIRVTVNRIIQSATATSQETAGEDDSASMAIDGNPQTIWHTKWNKSDVLPQSITLKLGTTFAIDKVTYLPRQSGGNGIITGYNVFVSKDGVTFTKVASGTWANNNAEKVVTFDPTDALYVKLEATAGVNGWASAAEINVFEVEHQPPTTTDNAPSGWVNQDVTVTLSASDNESGVANTYYIVDDGAKQTGTTVVLSEEGVHKLVYWSVDKAGNVERAHTVSVSIDKTAPSIVVSVPGDNNIYKDSVDLTPQIAWTDNLSGVDSSKTTVTLDTYSYQIGTAIPLYKLPLGQHTLIVTSSDMAGNVGSKTVHFQTVASIDSLKALVTRFADAKWIDNGGIANSLQAKLANNNLKSFVNEVEAQSGKHISSEAVTYLLRDAQYLLTQK
ncbi:discoidin domain-containing protein [Paenibacillus alginolyticus]|uniref:discoidin domain-containing protein n=2 Tax=Paenibacillus alginolyticus TaxID=59839 RepID=UPI00244BD6C1|nr:discoidin domain-containing protein [Paenibacillus alginolyticus]